MGKLDKAHLAQLEELRKAPADKFDERYLSGQVVAHADASAFQQAYAEKGDESTLKQAASSMVPVVNDHLNAAWVMSGVPKRLQTARNDEMTMLAQNTQGSGTYRGYRIYGGETETGAATTGETGRTTGTAGTATPETGATTGTTGTPPSTSTSTSTTTETTTGATTRETTTQPSTTQPGTTTTPSRGYTTQTPPPENQPTAPSETPSTAAPPPGESTNPPTSAAPGATTPDTTPPNSSPSETNPQDTNPPTTP
jgi:hypothetical protein